MVVRLAVATDYQKVALKAVDLANCSAVPTADRKAAH
jgi:hypothetical protein